MTAPYPVSKPPSLPDFRNANDKRIHIILDNYSTHKHVVVKRWLARHPRFELHLRLLAHPG